MTFSFQNILQKEDAGFWVCCGCKEFLFPLQSLLSTRYTNSSVMLLILGEAHGKCSFVPHKQVNRGVMPRGRCVFHRGRLGISPLGMASWEGY